MSDELKSQIKQAIVRSLRLPIDPDEIDSAAPLFGAGLGLDSIDVLELVLEIERSFGVVDRRRADRRPGAALGRHHRRVRHGAAQPSAGQSPQPAERTRDRTRSPSTSRSGSTSAACRPLAEPSALGRARVAGRRRHAAPLDLLDRCGVRATFFVVGWVAERHPRLVARIRDAGHEIGSHGQWHRRVYELDRRRVHPRPAARQRRARPRPARRQSTQFRAPEWSINGRAPWALERLAAEGFTVDSSRAPLRVVGDPMYPRARRTRLRRGAAPIVEVPPAVERPARPADAVRRRLGPAPGPAGPRDPRDRAAQRPRRAGHLLDSSVGAGSRSAADDVPRRRGVRPLLPPLRLDEPAARRSCAARLSVP